MTSAPAGSSVARRKAVARRAWGAWVAVCLIWGTTYLAIKVGLNTIPPLLLGGFRYLLAAIIMIAGLKLSGRPLPPRST